MGVEIKVIDDHVRFVTGDEEGGDYFEIYWDKSRHSLTVRSGWTALSILPDCSNVIHIRKEALR